MRESSKLQYTTLIICVIRLCSTFCSAFVISNSLNATCLSWFGVLDDIQTNMFGGGTCNDLARAAIRLTFHDGIGRSMALSNSGEFGGEGADGSIITFSRTELSYPANKGLELIVDALGHFADAHGVSYGDIIQFAGAVATSNCPGAPRLPFHAGRPNAIAPSPPDLVPSPSDSVEMILARMSDAGLTTEDTIALLAAHSVGKQRTLDLNITGMPFDTTPDAFDTQFYLDTSLRGTVMPGPGRSDFEVKSPSKDEFRIASDAAFARHPLTACVWQSFVVNQSRLQGSFSQAMIKLANAGHSNLIDCSIAIPPSRSWSRLPVYPPGKSRSDIDHSCSTTAFPDIPSDWVPVAHHIPFSRLM
ncbi:GP generic peroxidase [Gelatoporia subvermispora B]|uniref:Peroxidase n=1 Tax=Ceriporiopsis subvermispora (strain B) TaxID=914234 RepID=M2PTB7_CERS8|nr:GP generic peroxidase [Gelatoporia subvermispora B]